MRWKFREPHQITEILIINIYEGLKINVLLIQPLCQISKRLYRKSKPCDCVRSAPSHKNYTDIFQPRRGVTNVRYSVKINHLPLMMFIWWHSQVSMLDNKCVFCSIMSLFMSKNLSFVGEFSSEIQRHNARSQHQDEWSKSTIKVSRNMSNDV